MNYLIFVQCTSRPFFRSGAASALTVTGITGLLGFESICALREGDPLGLLLAGGGEGTKASLGVSGIQGCIRPTAMALHMLVSIIVSLKM